ncbi:AlkA N-terminal domain-containing protein [Ornithinicoccus halotolerans]|uniref:AlkA N-terminal domain-containing protein n=1 Tax=Ornithinicoccus halotolerans TaxID=1748220 RepID=UPI001295FB79|nr:AlkA N-terminal domain-containing protein [Ornithinicoccus halotolerans]
MHHDTEACLRAVRSRDVRFDGWFVTAVTSTGIYCRPSCPAMTPRERHLRFYATAAAAQAAGFRACKRCRPDATPGSPEWHVRGDLVARAMRLVADGVVDTEGVGGLARRLGYSTRQVERALREEVGAGPLGLARAQRAQTARVLIETTDLPMTEVAFAAGFGSLRSFNDTIRAVFATAPTALRESGRRGRDLLGAAGPTVAASGTAGGPRAVVPLRLPYRPPWHAASLLGHLAATAVPGVERWRDGGLERTLRLPHGPGTVRLTPADGHVSALVRLHDLRDLTPAVARCRRLLDLDADPVAVDELLGAADPALADAVRSRPGCRIPGAVEPEELAVRAVLGQQVSTRAAATTTARLAAAVGPSLPSGWEAGGPGRLFPTAAELAALDPDDARWPGMPSARRCTLVALSRALADGTLPLADQLPRERVRTLLEAVPGVGPWTREIVLLRGLGDPDAFPASDLGVRAGARVLGLHPGRLEERAARWRPWRGYATALLWSMTGHAVARHPDSMKEPA